MISPSGQNSGSVTGVEEWRHGAVNCEWRSLKSRRILLAGPATMRDSRRPSQQRTGEEQGLGCVQAREIQAVGNERRAVSVRTESRRCRSASVSLPGLWSRPRAPQLSQNGIFLSSERGQKKCSIKKPGLCRRKCVHRRARTCTQSLAHSHRRCPPSYYAFINQKLVTGINLKRWWV